MKCVGLARKGLILFGVGLSVPGSVWAQDGVRHLEEKAGDEQVQVIELNSTQERLGVDPFYEIKRIRIRSQKLKAREVTETELKGLQEEFHREAQESSSCLNEQNNNPLSIADIALKVWQVIQDNKAVLNVSTQNVKALPYIAKDRWESLTGWRPEHGLNYTLELENLYGMSVVELQYGVRLIYGGSVNKVGKYIASARIVPIKVDVLWGFELDVNAREIAVQNLATEANPFAAITLELGLSYGSILRKMSHTQTFRFDANGEIHDMTAGKTYFRVSR